MNPTCKTHGNVGPGQMCAYVIVGGKECGYKGECEHKGKPQVLNFHVQGTVAGQMAEQFEQIQAQMAVPASVLYGGHRPPQDVIDAAYKVGKWFEEHSLRGWKPGPCMDRFEGDVPRQQAAEQGLRYALRALKNIAQGNVPPRAHANLAYHHITGAASVPPPDLRVEAARFEERVHDKHPLFPLKRNDHLDGTIEYHSAGTQHMWRGWLLAKEVV